MQQQISNHGGSIKDAALVLTGTIYTVLEFIMQNGIPTLVGLATLILMIHRIRVARIEKKIKEKELELKDIELQEHRANLKKIQESLE